MGQSEILDFLKENKGIWFSSKEIAKGLGNSLTPTTNALKKLRKIHWVTYKVEKPMLYKHKDEDETLQ